MIIGGVKKKIKLFGIVLAFAIVMIPVGINAEDTLQSKISSANSGDTITLDKDYTEDITIEEDQNITIDLNGKSLQNATGHTITNKGILTIKGTGNITNTTNQRAPLFNDKGTVTIENGSFSRVDSTGNSFYVILNHGKMTINGGSFSIKNGISSLIDNGWYTPEENTDKIIADMTINGGSFSIENNTKYIKNDDYGKMTINGGNFKATNGAVIANLGAAGNVEKVSINDGIFEYAGSSYAIFDFVYASNGGNKKTISINGGTFKITNDQAKVSNNPDNENFEATEDGTIEIKSADYTEIAELLEEMLKRFSFEGFANMNEDEIEKFLEEHEDEIEKYFEKYTDESVAALERALNSIDFELDITKQDEVDKMANDLENAINGLEEKTVTTTEEIKNTKTENKIENPNTLDNLVFYIITLVVSMGVVVASSMYLKKRMN